MVEELYNSNDYCSLAEELEELKKENAELSRDKERLMDLFMERSEYIFDVVANMKINDLERKCKALKADYVISNREMLIMQVEIGRLKSKLDRRDADIVTLNNRLTDAVTLNGELVEKVESRDEIIARLKEDAERLASNYVIEVFPHEWVCRGGCHHWARFGEQIDHAPDCPIALHRALMKELE